ncbi:mitogen-activated protein kinase kinase kinase 4 isoform X2 [Perognathus longimembris pacificus]|uniref:mitogen-activated protein kinase kinase kinase 4 isoform X2 n=1 Tax=Perognathus longimembris pacificus TaxID=214514 RepID=UPI00201886FA|nr:mitogen-activated protein kinase kinase kinase 4 isoform X2 [Perognathus longimembris pacificus]
MREAAAAAALLPAAPALAVTPAAAMEEPPPPPPPPEPARCPAARQECVLGDSACKNPESDPEDFSDETNTENLYGTSPPSTPRQMKRMSTKHQRNSVGRPASRSNLKEKMNVPNQPPHKDTGKVVENVEEYSYKQEKKIRATLRTTERDHKKNVQCSFMLDSVGGSLPKKSIPDVDLNKPYLSLGCSNAKLPVSVPMPIARTTRQTSRTDCPADRLKFFETLRLLLKLTSVSKKKDREQRGQENTSAFWFNRSNELIWLELQAWHAGRTINDQDLFLYTARQAIPDIINEILNFKVNYGSVAFLRNGAGFNGTSVEGQCRGLHGAKSVIGYSTYHEHLQRQRVSFEQVKRIMELLEYIEALYPSLQALQKDYEKYAAKDFQDRVQALCLWLNITKDLNQKLRIMGTVLGIKNLSDIGWPVFEIPSPRPSKGNEPEDKDDDTEGELKELESSTDESEGDQAPESRVPGPRPSASNSLDVLSQELGCRKPERLDTEDEAAGWGPADSGTEAGFDRHCLTSIYRPFVDKALKQMGLRKLILRLHKLMHGSLQRARLALVTCHGPVEFSEFPDPMWGSDYVQLSRTPPSSEQECSAVSWDELKAMDLPSFEPAFLVLCRVLLNVIHECLKLRLEQRPAGEPSLLSIKQLVRECKEVLKGGLLMKQYYQFMLQEVLGALEKMDCNIDAFEEDLHKMLMVYFDYMRSWIQMLQQLPQASHSLKNLLEEEWNFTKEITHYIRGGEAQAGKLFCDIAGMLLKSTGSFLEFGLQESCAEFWSSADDSSASDEIRRSVIEISRALKELFHEARERASKALGFAKMLRKDLEIAAEFVLSAPVGDFLDVLKAKQYVKVQVPGLENLPVFVPDALAEEKGIVLQLLNAAAGKGCSKDPDDVLLDAHLLLTKPGDPADGSWGSWDTPPVKIVPPVETVDTLKSMQVENFLLVVMQSTHLTSQRKAFQQSTEGLMALRHEQTSSQPVIAKALQQLKNDALELCNRISHAIDRVDRMFTWEFDAEVDESESVTLQQYHREAMIQGYNFGFEYHKEVVRLMSGEFRQKIGDKYISFARKWMNYVLTKCESGRGTRPRWATQGFDFLQAIEPAFISALPEDDFLSLQALMNECIGHVIGKPHSPVTAIHRNSPRPVKVPRCHSDPPNPHLIIPTPEGLSTRVPSDARSHGSPAAAAAAAAAAASATTSTASRPGPCGGDPVLPKPISGAPDTRGSSVPENDRLASIAAELQFRSLSRHSSPTEEREEPAYPRGDSSGSTRRSWELRTLLSHTKDTASRQGPMEAIQKSVRLFEEKRYREMRRKNIIGQVCDTPKSYDNVMHVGLRKVTFKWQRGNKIGEGQYGKVYTCISVDTGELMAMKEIRFQPNDHKTIKETADELKIFEGLKHPNLVRYFGVELHREEMYIFMEYCDEGTLEEVSRLGLQEHVIRLYSKQITVAINVLHEHGIVHRDIKGANIFLTSSGLIKLGDFGCSVKLKNNAQTMPGEVNSTLGTAAYMAPEVITRAKGEGHGRAADIWSLGCVVIEMVTGKRPWHEYEHNFQIMYKVGMGHKPPIPERLSPEGKDFLSHCLESDPKLRWTASQLLDHSFVKVCTDEE